MTHYQSPDKQKSEKFFVSTIFKFLIVLTIAFPAIIFAQTQTLEVAVKDSNSAAIAGASVVLRNTKTGFERSATIGADGTFVFRNLDAAEYEVSILANGFARQTRPARTGERVEFVLTPSNLREEVTVYSASRQDELRESLNTKVEVLTQNDIRDTGYETIGEVLREVPGVLTRRGSEGTGAGEQIQGIDSRQVLVLLDGFPVIGARY